MLSYPDYEQPFHIRADSSENGCGAVLYQLDKDNSPRPLYFYSKKYNDVQMRYTIPKKEILAIIGMLHQVRHIVYGYPLTIYPLTIYTDSPNATFFKNTKSMDIQRYGMYIAEYTDKLEHISGISNKTADMLSRYFQTPYPHRVLAIADFPLSVTFIAQEQTKDELLQLFINKHLDPQSVIIPRRHNKYYNDLQYDPQKHALFRNYQIIVPKHIVQYLLDAVHSYLAHPGINRMIESILEFAYWPSLRTDYRNFCNRCRTCKESKRNTIQCSPLTATTVNRNIRPFQTVAVDLMGPLPISRISELDEDSGNQADSGVEYKYILSMIDIKTRFIELVPMQTQLADELVDMFHDNWLARYPRCETVLSDNGPNLVADAYEELLLSYGIKHIKTTTYSATANAIVERSHDTINQSLRCLGYDKWHTKLQGIAFAMRAAFHQTLKTSPGMLVYGRNMLMPDRKLSPQAIDELEQRVEEQVLKDLERANTYINIVKMNMYLLERNHEKRITSGISSIMVPIRSSKSTTTPLISPLTTPLPPTISGKFFQLLWLGRMSWLPVK